MSDVELLTIGRVNLDLYAQQLGVEFAAVEGFDAMVGGSPANVAVAAARLGVRTGLLSAVGEDFVGDWVLRALDREGVDTEFVVRKAGPHSSLALRAQLAPDHPLVFYRHDPADIHLTGEDVSSAPVEGARALLVSGDALARGSMADVCASVAARARRVRTPVYLDLDLRAVSWPGLQRYAKQVGAMSEHADVVLGTEAEFAALLGLAVDADADAVAEVVLERLGEPEGRVVILKRGDRGALAIVGQTLIDVPAYAIDEASTVGAGDSFAAGLIAARFKGLDWEEAARYGSACAAITVSRFGCSDGLPTLEDVQAFIDQRSLAAKGVS